MFVKGVHAPSESEGHEDAISEYEDEKRPLGNRNDLVTPGLDSVFQRVDVRRFVIMIG